MIVNNDELYIQTINQAIVAARNLDIGSIDPYKVAEHFCQIAQDTELADISLMFSTGVIDIYLALLFDPIIQDYFRLMRDLLTENIPIGAVTDLNPEKAH